MSAVEKWDFVSVDEYLAEEKLSPLKREYRDGAVYAMADARNRHNRIAGNSFGVLYPRLRDHPCQLCNSDTKIRIRQLSGTRFYYPNLLIVCQQNPPNETFQDAPVVVLEVSSPSTRRIDLVAESNSAAVQVFRRSPDGDFQRELTLGLEAVIPLPEIGASLTLAELYEDVEFSEESNSLRVSEDCEQEGA